MADSRERNLATAGAIYQAFGTGDIPTILSHLADDVLFDADWADNFAQRGQGPNTLKPRRGHAGAGEFFAAVGASKVEEFQVVDILASGNQVAAQITIATSSPNGGKLRDEEIHLWKFNEDGKVVAIRHYCDTAKHIEAAKGVDTTVKP
ncbi:hypothetical protein DFJ74DRAFT_458693 [Hyaloraphidium curvatum]|nr:hypothetical protein DFJ74DRAFT_458693 [Hyaloraphidium curvatum]